MTARINEHIDCMMENNPIAVAIVDRAVTALEKAGRPVVSIDTMVGTPVPIESAYHLFALISNLKDCLMVTADGAWVRIVRDNGRDTLVDYAVGLDQALRPVHDWIRQTSANRLIAEGIAICDKLGHQ